MRVELDDPALADDLLDYLRATRFQADPEDGRTFEVVAPGLPERLARLKLEGVLAGWCASHPGVRVRRKPRYEL